MDSPISLQDIEKIASTHLSAVEKHHLRLLAHCLACFQEMQKERSIQSLPTENIRLEWLHQQQKFAKDEGFIHLLNEQFSSAANQLSQISQTLNIPPLELTLDDLIQFSLESSNVQL